MDKRIVSPYFLTHGVHRNFFTLNNNNISFGTMQIGQLYSNFISRLTQWLLMDSSSSNDEMVHLDYRSGAPRVAFQILLYPPVLLVVLAQEAVAFPSLHPPFYLSFQCQTSTQQAFTSINRAFAVANYRISSTHVMKYFTRKPCYHRE